MTTQELLNYPLLEQLVLELINPSYGIDFKNILKEKAIDISDDIESASKNSQCECRNKISSFVTVYPLKAVGAIVNYIENFTDGNIKVEEAKNVVETHMSSDRSVIHYGGKVAKTTIAEWSEFCDKIYKENGTFKGFSVVKEGSDIFVFFI